MAKIALDPGHGGSTKVGGSSFNNAVGPSGTLEKTLTLDIGLKARDVLEGRGHAVLMTRETDVNLGLAARARVARDSGAEVFVSIHFNGSTGHNAQGTETLVHKNFSNISAKLSLAVQDALLEVTKLRDRNKSFDPSTRIKPQSLGVLRPTRHLSTTAACLVEVSFLDRADEEARLADEDYRQAIAVALADGIEAHLGLDVVRTIDADDDEQGDAIEISATEGGTSAFKMLGLEAAESSSGDDPEAGEREGAPRNPFNADFVNATPKDDTLFVAQPEDEEDFLEQFKAFLAPLNLRHFTADEVLFLGNSHHGSGKCSGKNAHPPKALWPKIEPTIVMLDEIRNRLGAPIRILSCYRNTAYNKCVGGASKSLHMEFVAIDFTASAGTPEIWRRIASSVRDSDPAFKGGIGKYVSRNFVHIDTRGKNVDWTKA